MRTEGLATQVACRVLGVSESGSTPGGPDRRQPIAEHWSYCRWRRFVFIIGEGGDLQLSAVGLTPQNARYLPGIADHRLQANVHHLRSTTSRERFNGFCPGGHGSHFHWWPR